MNRLNDLKSGSSGTCVERMGLRPHQGNGVVMFIFFRIIFKWIVASDEKSLFCPFLLYHILHGSRMKTDAQTVLSGEIGDETC